MKKTGLFLITFIITYLSCCYLIRDWIIKLEADPFTYFLKSIKHMALLKGLISLITSLIVSTIPTIIKKITKY